MGYPGVTWASHSLVNHVKKACLPITKSLLRAAVAQPGRTEGFGWLQGAGDGLVTLREALGEEVDRQALAMTE